MDITQAITLLVIALGAFVVPLLSGRVGVPAAVGEIAFGMLVGPFVLGIVAETEFFGFLAEFGFAFLMFLAGLELNFASLERKGGRVLWLSLGIAILTIGLAFLAASRMGWSPFWGIVLGATSIGLVLVTLRETGAARSDFGQTVILVGSIGEFLTIIIATLYNIVFRFGFGMAFVGEVIRLIAVFAVAYLVLKTLRLLVWWFPSQFSRMIDIEDTSEVGVRAGMALMIAFVAVSELLGMEAILGAFLAGALFSFVFREKGILETKLAGIGHGFFIPVFFIYVGVSFNLGALGNRDIYPLMGQILILSLLVKVIASTVLAAMHFGPRQIAGASLLLATPLTLLVAIAALGLELGALNDMESASVILVAVMSSLLFPTAFRRLGITSRAVVAEASPE
jgi:Kef-type K+ transport system membrane component KefB